MANANDILRKLIPRDVDIHTTQEHSDEDHDQDLNDFLIELITEQNEQQ